MLVVSAMYGTGMRASEVTIGITTNSNSRYRSVSMVYDTVPVSKKTNAHARLPPVSPLPYLMLCYVGNLISSDGGFSGVYVRVLP